MLFYYTNHAPYNFHSCVSLTTWCVLVLFTNDWCRVLNRFATFLNCFELKIQCKLYSQWKKVHWLMYLLINFYRDSHMWVKTSGPIAIHYHYKSNDISCNNTFGVKKCGQVKQNHTWKWMHEQIGDDEIWYQNMAKGLGILNTLILHWIHHS